MHFGAGAFHRAHQAMYLDRLMSAGQASDWAVCAVGMVDRITPVTTAADIDRLRADFGVKDAWPVVCEPYVQWVLEDDFPAGRPRWQDCGVQLVTDVRRTS